MPSLVQILYLILAIFPLCRLQQNNNRSNLNPRFIVWMNSLFYIPNDRNVRVRKEYRLMTDTERRDYHRAIIMLKNDRVSSFHMTYIVSVKDPIVVYSDWIYAHQKSEARNGSRDISYWFRFWFPWIWKTCQLILKTKQHGNNLYYFFLWYKCALIEISIRRFYSGIQFYLS